MKSRRTVRSSTTSLLTQSQLPSTINSLEPLLARDKSPLSSPFCHPLMAPEARKAAFLDNCKKLWVAGSRYILLCEMSCEEAKFLALGKMVSSWDSSMPNHYQPSTPSAAELSFLLRPLPPLPA